jgi:hypothetical protein
MAASLRSSWLSRLRAARAAGDACAAERHAAVVSRRMVPGCVNLRAAGDDAELVSLDYA